MAKILDFKTKYVEKVFSIDPSFSKQNGLGWSIINRDAEFFGGKTNAPIIHRSGILKPFSTASNLMAMDELCDKFIEIWRHDSGYSREPAVLVIEQPEIYPGSPVRFSNLTDLSIFVGMLVNGLSPRLTLAPTPREWKGNKKKADTQAEIENISDFHSKRALKRDLDMVATHVRHNIFDALGLGIYGAEVDLGKRPLPRLFRR
jgi:hypothetical protein